MYLVQLFTPDSTIFSKKKRKIAHANIKKLPSKVAYFTTKVENFRATKRPKTHQNLNFCFIKIAHFKTYV